MWQYQLATSKISASYQLVLIVVLFWPYGSIKATESNSLVARRYNLVAATNTLRPLAEYLQNQQ